MGKMVVLVTIAPWTENNSKEFILWLSVELSVVTIPAGIIVTKSATDSQWANCLHIYLHLNICSEV